MALVRGIDTGITTRFAARTDLTAGRGRHRLSNCWSRGVLHEGTQLHNTARISPGRRDDETAVIVCQDEHAAIAIGAIDACPRALPLGNDAR